MTDGEGNRALKRRRDSAEVEFHSRRFLYCGGGTGGMLALPMYYSQPTTLDIHAYTCIVDASTGTCTTATPDTQNQSTTLFNDVKAFITWRGLTSDLVVFGETTPPDQTCSDLPRDPDAGYLVAGYVASSLYSTYGSSVVLRPWDQLYNTCFNRHFSGTVSTRNINPPYDSLH